MRKDPRDMRSVKPKRYSEIIASAKEEDPIIEPPTAEVEIEDEVSPEVETVSETTESTNEESESEVESEVETEDESTEEVESSEE